MDNLLPKLVKSLAVILSVFISSCLYLPETEDEKVSLQIEKEARCETVTKKVNVEKHEIAALKNACQGSSAQIGLTCAASTGVLASVIAGGSFVVSSSVALVGNSVHWVEVNATCLKSGEYEEESIFTKVGNKFVKLTNLLNPFDGG